ncbi:MAG: preprotein translocase subunit SecA [Candidatus Sumerlaeia bacterium]|nr:preprotein translocase subunit SecA [Candidatus Sumerlaeia bacterium]
MIKSILRFFLGDKQKRDQARLKPVMDEINRIAAEYQQLTDEQVADKTHEFRKLLHVTIRTTARFGQLVLLDDAGLYLRNHPDVEEAVFVSSRRDHRPGKLFVFVVPKATGKPGEDLAMQIQGGMGRPGPGFVPDHIVFLDRIPRTDPERRKSVDYHTLTRVAEELALDKWSSHAWAELSGKLKPEEPAVELKDLLPDAFAAVKESCRRMCGKKWMAGGNEVTWNMVPFDVQLMGGVALTQQGISEMGTGEGKTLTAIGPLYYHALAGRGSHLVTVNDYLSKRDSEWNGPIFEFLGMRVDCIDKSEPHSPPRRAAYLADVTYGTNNEFGFDYLRDNMATEAQQLVQRDYFFAIVDEADSALIDEARTPLIISGPVDREVKEYDRMTPAVRDLVNRQTTLVNGFVKEAEELFEKEETKYEAGVRMLQTYKGAPKHTRYGKLRQTEGILKWQEKAELDYLAQKKMVELESDLFYVVDEKQRQVDLTEKGRQALSPNSPEMFVMMDLVDEFAKIDKLGLDEEAREKARAEVIRLHDQRAERIHVIQQLLTAYALKQKDVDYVVEEGKVVIVDEFTGRKMVGRRWSDGLHQAVEAKEGLQVQSESQTLATVTIQNYFRMYQHLAGMTGTAETEAAEFMHTYKMDVIVIPPNKATGRKDLQDVVYKTKREKYAAVIEEVRRMNALGLPVLVGTTSVQTSETLSRMFRSAKLEHEVLNAKNHLREAHIVAQAGQPGAITIATNMAGRGTDIKLGAGVAEPRKEADGTEWPGGLQIIGTERHEARRIDRQLRGRSGRQGDPGTSRFFLSLEDDLILWFGGNKIQNLMGMMGMEEGEAITHPWLTSSIERAQKKVEQINHERRKRTLEFDNVLNEQRKTVYGLRRDLILEENVRDVMLGIFADTIENEFLDKFADAKNMGEADMKGFADWLQKSVALADFSAMRGRNYDKVEKVVDDAMDLVVQAFDTKYAALGPQVGDQLCRYIAIRTLDTNWIDHLLAIDDLREAVFLRGYGQRDPLLEYTRDATMLFKSLMLEVHKQVLERFFRAQVELAESETAGARVQRAVAAKPQVQSVSEAMAAQAAAQGDGDQPIPRQAPAEAEEPQGPTPPHRAVPMKHKK